MMKYFRNNDNLNDNYNNNYKYDESLLNLIDSCEKVSIQYKPK